MVLLFAILLPFLIVDLINPILLGGVVYSLGSKHPIANGCMVLVSFFATYFLAGIAIAVSLELFTGVLKIPQGFDYVLELLVAVLLFYTAWSQYQTGDQHLEEELPHERGMTLWGAAFLGFQINLVGLPFAVPYLAAIDQVLKAELSVPEILLILLLYNVGYIFPFTLLVVLRIFYKKKSDAVFEAVTYWMHRFCDRYMPVILFILGLLLVEDAVSFLLGYRVYSFLSLI
jgi:cytochrome c biogenesis protein CcdA